MQRLIWLVIGWAFTAALVVGLYLRWSSSSRTYLIALIGVLPLVLLGPLAGLALSAWRADSAYLRLAALGTAVVYLATFVTIGSVVGCGPETAEDGIVIYSHNTYWEQGDPEAIAAQIAAIDPDVIVLQEVWPEMRATLEATEGLAPLRYRTTEALDIPTGVIMWSRWPMSEARLSYLDDRPLIRALLDTPSGPLTVHGVHLAAPTTPALTETWVRNLSQLAELDVAAPAVMAGDFNSTADHGQFRNLLSQGWTDVHEVKGCGFDATWPVGRRLPFSVLRLDHVLVSDGIEVLGVEIGPAAGSDHRAVVATIRLAPGTEAG